MSEAIAHLATPVDPRRDALAKVAAMFEWPLLRERNEAVCGDAARLMRKPSIYRVSVSSMYGERAVPRARVGRPLQPCAIEDPRQGNNDGESDGERDDDVGQHGVRPMQRVHDRFDDLQDGERGDAVPDQCAEDAPALELPEQRHGVHDAHPGVEASTWTSPGSQPEDRSLSSRHVDREQTRRRRR